MALTSGILGILKQLGLPPWLFGDSVLVLPGIENASANSDSVNAGLFNHGSVEITTDGLYYHDKTFLVESMGSLITASGVEFKLAPGAACNQVRNRYAQNTVDIVFVTVSATGLVTVTEKGHNRKVGESVYVENAKGNLTLNGRRTILATGKNVNGLFWQVQIASAAPFTNDAFTPIYVMYDFPIAGSSFSRAATSSAVTISNASPGVVTYNNHFATIADPVLFTTTGALPDPLVPDTIYYVQAVQGINTFTLSATPYGPVIATTTAGSGVHTAFLTGVVTVTEPGHQRRMGDSPYITGIPVGLNSFNGSYLITDVLPGVSWKYKQIGKTEVGSGTACIQCDTEIFLDLWAFNYDSANNIFSQLGAVNVVLGNIANSEFWFHQLIDGRSRAVQLFNGGMAVRVPLMVSSSQAGTNSKGTLQVESFGGDLYVGDCIQLGSTDDCLAWGVTTNVAPFGATASPSGAISMGTLHADKLYERSSNTVNGGASLKVFSTVDYVGMGTIYVGDMGGDQGAGPVIQNLSPLGKCWIDSLHIGMLRNRPEIGSPQFFVSNWQFINSFRIDELYDRQWQANKYTGTFDTSTVRDFHIGSLIMPNNRATEIGIIVNTGTVIENFTVDSSYITAQNGFDAIRVQGTAVIQNANLNNTRYVASGIFLGNYIGCNSGGTVQSLNVNNYKGNNRAIISDGVSGSATALKAKFSNVTCAGLVNLSTAQNATIYLSNVEQGTNGANMLSLTGSGTIRVSGENVDHFAGLFCQLTTGTFSVSIDCRDAKIDLGASAGAPPARLVPLAGDQLFNTNAVGTGTYGRTNAGAWQLLY